MKKIIWLFMIFLLAFAVPACAEAKVVYEENFESFRIGEIPEDAWTYETNDKSIGVYAEVTQDPIDSGNKCFKYIRETGSLVNATLSFKPIGGKVTVEYRFLIADTPNEVLYIGVIPGTSGFMTYKNVYEYGGGVQNLAPTPNVWHTMKVEINFNEKFYNSYIDGSQVKNEVELTNMDLDSMDKIQYYFGAGYVMLDDIKITEEGGIQKNYTKLSMDKYYYSSILRGIFNVPVDTTPEEFLKNIEFVKGAKRAVYEKDGITPYKGRFLEDFAVLKVQSPDNTQEWNVTINIRPWKAGMSTVKAAYKCAVVFEDSPNVLIKNRLSYIDESNPQIKVYYKDGELYAPLRRIAESFGYNVGWDEETASVSVDGEKVGGNIENVSGVSFMKASDLAELLNKKLILNDKSVAVFAPEEVNIDDKSITVFREEILERRKEK